LIKTKDVDVLECTAPGSTVNFTAFSPCLSAATGTVWYLVDTRESNNIQTYKVKKMPDGHIWMVQDLKFGNLCKNNSYSSGSSNKTGGVSTIGTYYGNCTNATNSSTPSNRGYLYDWAAAINKAGAYAGGSAQGCSGTSSGTTATNPGACMGICPTGWHLPTGGGTAGEFLALYNAMTSYSGCAGINCWTNAVLWEATNGGWCGATGSIAAQNSAFVYWSSTKGSNCAYVLTDQSRGTIMLTLCDALTWGESVRCIMNY
jgi:uncharacterized protein (TIGR02145 family)